MGFLSDSGWGVMQRGILRSFRPMRGVWLRMGLRLRACKWVARGLSRRCTTMRRKRRRSSRGLMAGAARANADLNKVESNRRKRNKPNTWNRRWARTPVSGMFPNKRECVVDTPDTSTPKRMGIIRVCRPGRREVFRWIRLFRRPCWRCGRFCPSVFRSRHRSQSCVFLGGA